MVNNLETTRPEDLGISSNDIEKFINIMEENKVCLHSFIMMRHGKIAAEGYWKPFDKTQLHRMYSVSKTFAAAAIGILYDQGKISLDDKVIKYFPDKLPKGDLHPYVANMTIKDLLIMATPYDNPTYGLEDDYWSWTFFNTKPSHPSGTIFNYDSSGSYILGVIVERITGMSILEYMRKDLLDPIGFTDNARFLKTYEGHSWAGSGVMATTRDLAKFALVFLNGGKYNGKQLISEEYVKAATSKQIDNNPQGLNYLWSHGYGYQIWLLKDGAFAFRGMGSQQVICDPKKDFLFACTGDTQGSKEAGRVIYDAVLRKVIDNISDEHIPGDDEAYIRLSNKCKSLSIIPEAGEKEGKILDKVNGITYHLNDNPMQISKIAIKIDGDEGCLYYTNPRGDKKLHFGIKKYLEGNFPETHYFGETFGEPVNRMYRSISCGTWVEPGKLLIKTYIIDDYLGNLTMTLSFKGEEVGFSVHKTAEFFLDEYQGFAGGHSCAKGTGV